MDKIAYLDELIILSDIQKKQFNEYYIILNEMSKVMNLTTITEELDVYIKHFYDSILALKHIKNTDNLTLLDIGSGAGFPGIVLKIVHPNLKITLLEPTKKRCDFLELVINKLNLKGIEVVNDRAENYIKERRSTYDFVTARAVAGLNILLELGLAYVKNSGHFIAMKGSNYEEELAISHNAISKMGGKVDQIYEYNLPLEYGKRCILTIKKVKNTPISYPRIYSKIKKQPL